MAHPRRNFLAKIKVNEVWLTEEDEIKEGVPQAFFNLLFDLMDQGLGIDEMYFDILDMQKGKKLKELFPKKEVFSAFLDLNENKALSQDGFSMASQLFSEKDDEFFRDFHEHGRF